MLDAAVRELRDDFAAGVSSIESDVTLDPSIANLREKISRADFLRPFSITRRGTCVGLMIVCVPSALGS